MASKNYRQLSEELEEVIDKLQSSDLDVDDVISEYQRGTAIIAQLEKYLKEAQNKISRIKPSSPKAK